MNAPTTAPLGAVTTVIPDNCGPDGVGVGVCVGVDVAVGVGVTVGVGAAAATCMNLATEGTPVEFKMKSM